MYKKKYVEKSNCAGFHRVVFREKRRFRNVNSSQNNAKARKNQVPTGFLVDENIISIYEINSNDSFK